MDFVTAVKTCFSKYAVFQGRASRSEFWWFELFVVLAQVAASIVGGLLVTYVVTQGANADGSGQGMFFSMQSGGLLTQLVSLALFLPNLAVTVRRLHDIGRRGWWVLLGLVPLVGFVILLIWWLRPSEPYANAYGPPPYPYLSVD